MLRISLILFFFAVTAMNRPIMGLRAESTWHGVAYSPAKAADKLLVDFGIPAPADWGTMEPVNKLQYITQIKSLPTSPLFSDENDLLDNCLAELAKAKSSAREELIAEYLLNSLEPPLDEQHFKTKALYILLREFKHTNYSLSIYQALRNIVLNSDKIDEAKSFINAFPQTVDSAAAIGHMYVLVDTSAQKARKNSDFPECFRLYSEFVKQYKDSAPALAVIATERLDAMTFEFIDTIIKDDNAKWKGKVLTTNERVAACEDYIRAFSASTERVTAVASIADTIQLQDWNATRVLIKEDAADAVFRIRAHLLEIGGNGFTFFDDATEMQANQDPSLTLLLTLKARRHANYLKTTISKIATQFPNNAAAQEAALTAITLANQTLALAKINSLLSDIYKELKKQSELLQAIVANTEKLNAQITNLSNELASNFASVKTSLDGVNANLANLNKISLETQTAIKEGFADVTAHLKESNSKLDAVVGEVNKMNSSLGDLGNQLNAGFEGVKQTIVDVSKKDITNTGFWGKGADAAGAVFDRACNQVSSWF